MRILAATAASVAITAASTHTLAQTSPPAWSNQGTTSGCPSGKGCHAALLTSALVGAVPAVTLGVEVGSGSSVRLGTTIRILMMGLGAASLIAGVWDTYVYRNDGPADYLPGVLVGGVLGGGSIIGNAVMFAIPDPKPDQSLLPRWRPSPMVGVDRTGQPWMGTALIGTF